MIIDLALKYVSHEINEVKSTFFQGKENIAKYIYEEKV